MLDAGRSLAGARVSGYHPARGGAWGSAGTPACSHRKGHPHVFPLIEVRGRKSSWEKFPLLSLSRAVQGEAERRRNHSGAVTPARHCRALRGRGERAKPRRWWLGVAADSGDVARGPEAVPGVVNSPLSHRSPALFPALPPNNPHLLRQRTPTRRPSHPDRGRRPSVLFPSSP